MDNYEKFFSPSNLRLAWERYIRGSQPEAKDYFGIMLWRENLDTNIGRLSDKLLNGTFKPSRPFKLYIPKPSLMQRTITRLNIEDALVYQAIADRIAADHYDELTSMSESVFGSVLHEEVKYGIDLFDMKFERNPKPVFSIGDESLVAYPQDEQNTKDIGDDPSFFFFKYYLPLYNEFANAVNTALYKEDNTYLLATDITGFFDSIPHYNLLSILSCDYDIPNELLELLEVCLNAWSGTREQYTFGVGIPQGSQPSFFFANLLLHTLDEDIATKGVRYFRYMDDMQVFARDRSTLRDILSEMDTYLRGCGLALNSSKTSVEALTVQKKKEVKKNLKTFSYNLDSKIETKIKKQEEMLDDDLDSEALGDEPTSNTSKGTISNWKSKTEWEEAETDEHGRIVPLSLSEIVSQKLPADDFVLHPGGDPTVPNDSVEKHAIIQNAKKLMTQCESTLLDEIKASKNTADLFTIFKNKEPELRDAAWHFKQAAHTLVEMDEMVDSKVPTEKWIQLMEYLPWRISFFGWPLQYYPPSKNLKTELFRLYELYSRYEWIQSLLLAIISFTQEFSDTELEKFIPKVHEAKSDLVRMAWYKLLLTHAGSRRLQQSLSKLLKKEKSLIVKKELLYYQIRKKEGRLTIKELYQEVGL